MNIIQIDDKSLFVAARLVATEWGSDSADDFKNQWQQCNPNRGAAFGCFIGTEIIGVGLVSESEISFGVWGLSWCVVTPRFRRQGVSRKLITAREEFACRTSRQGKATLVQVATPYPSIFEPIGYHKVWSWDDASLMVKYLADN